MLQIGHRLSWLLKTSLFIADLPFGIFVVTGPKVADILKGFQGWHSPSLIFTSFPEEK